MKKQRIINLLSVYISIIKYSPELFHKGIDIEIISVLEKAKKYIINGT